MKNPFRHTIQKCRAKTSAVQIDIVSNNILNLIKYCDVSDCDVCIIQILIQKNTEVFLFLFKPIYRFPCVIKLVSISLFQIFN